MGIKRLSPTEFADKNLTVAVILGICDLPVGDEVTKHHNIST